MTEDSKIIEKIDKAMAAKISNHDGMDWYTVDQPEFRLSGLPWYKPGDPFRRIPLDASVSAGVNHLAWNTAGVMLRFKTNAKEIRIDAKIWKNSRMDHMAHDGSMGFDVYLGSGCQKFYRQTTRFDQTKDAYITPVLGPLSEAKMREVTIHFPLYSGPEYLRIGLTEGAVIEEPTPWKDDRPIVVYGTSIQQGGCASRPGMCHTNQMSRMLNRPFINLAFSGSGKGEPAMAELIADIKNPAMIVLDYDANAHVDGLRATLSNFIDIIRKKHPVTPILLISKLPFAAELANEYQYPEERWEYQKIHMDELKKRRDAGDTNIHFLDGTALLGNDPSECTVDGIHATDLGFYMMAKHTAPVIARILEQVY